MGMTLRDLKFNVHAHPTVAEVGTGWGTAGGGGGGGGGGSTRGMAGVGTVLAAVARLRRLRAAADVPILAPPHSPAL